MITIGAYRRVRLDSERLVLGWFLGSTSWSSSACMVASDLFFDLVEEARHYV